MTTSAVVMLAAVAIAIMFGINNYYHDNNSNSYSAIVNSYAQRGKYLNFKGHAIWYLHQQNQPAPTTSKQHFIVFLHGFPTSSHDFEAIVNDKILKVNQNKSSSGSSVHTIVFDFLGFGLSDKPRGNNFRYTLMQQADVTEAVVRQVLNDELPNNSEYELHLIAHDYGVSVAQELLARQVEEQQQASVLKFSSVCFLNGGIIPGQHRPLLIQRLLLNPTVGPLLSMLGVNNFYTFRSSFNKIFGNETRPSWDELNTYWSFIKHKEGNGIFHLLIYYMQDRVEHRDRWVNTGLLEASKTVPMLFINGPCDPISGKHVMVEVQRLLEAQEHNGVKKQWEIKLLRDNIGHYPQVEDMNGVYEHYVQFVNKHVPQMHLNQLKQTSI